MPQRTFVLGDIHGHLGALEQCLLKSGFNKQKDLLIQIGDVSDRGPDTAIVVEKLLTIPHLIAIRGNHDEWTGEWICDGQIPPRWLKNGGQETFDSYESAQHLDLKKHQHFFGETQQDYYVDEQNRIFVHGGFSDPRGPAYDTPSTNCRWDRSLWETALGARGSEIKPSVLSQFSEIFIGHTPTTRWQTDLPMKAQNVWNVDTGAAVGGKLTIMNVHTKEYWQSDTIAN